MSARDVKMLAYSILSHEQLDAFSGECANLPSNILVLKCKENYYLF